MFERNTREMLDAYRRTLVTQGIIDRTWPYSTASLFSEVYAKPLRSNPSLRQQLVDLYRDERGR